MKKAEPDKYPKYRSALAIDRDDLDDALLKQPVLYCDVADAYAEAIAERDACTLELDEAKAKHGLALREEAVKHKERLTEGHLEHCLAEIGEIHDLQRELLGLKAAVERWKGLKTSYEQRKDVLEKMVPLHLSRVYGVSSISTPRQELADANRMLAGQERVRRRFVEGHGRT